MPEERSTEHRKHWRSSDRTHSVSAACTHGHGDWQRPPTIWLRGSITAMVTVDTVRSAALTVREYLHLCWERSRSVSPLGDRPLRAANVFVRRAHGRRARLCCSGMCRRRFGESRRSHWCLAARLVSRRHEWSCAFVHHPRICDFGARASRAEKSRLHFKRRAQAGAQCARRSSCRRGNSHSWSRRAVPGGVPKPESRAERVRLWPLGAL